MKVCDRCGELIGIVQEKSRQEVTPMAFVTLFDVVEGRPIHTNIDLCGKCQREFLEEFMRKSKT